MIRRQPSSTLVPYTTLFRSLQRRDLLLGRAAARPRRRRRVGGHRDAPRQEPGRAGARRRPGHRRRRQRRRSEEHTSELQSRQYLVCRLLLEKKNLLYIVYAE